MARVVVRGLCHAAVNPAAPAAPRLPVVAQVEQPQGGVAELAHPPQPDEFNARGDGHGRDPVQPLALVEVAHVGGVHVEWNGKGRANSYPHSAAVPLDLRPAFFG